MMKRLIDANALEGNIAKMLQEPGYQHTEECWRNGLHLALEAVDEAPTVDAVEVIRCKDCEWYDGILCTNLYGLTFCNPNSFCCYGERKAK